MTRLRTSGSTTWAALALTVLLLAWGRGARAEVSTFVSFSDASKCSVAYEVKPDGAAAWTHIVGILWKPDGAFAFLLLGQNLDRLGSVPLQVTSATGAVFSGNASAPRPGDEAAQAHLMWTNGRKDLDKALVGDLTFSFRDQSGKSVKITAPFGLAAPKIDTCMTSTATLAAAQPPTATPGQPDADTPGEGESQAVANAKPGEVIGNGSGFAVDLLGDVVTAGHVVAPCGFLTSPALGQARVVAVDTASDLALLRFADHPASAVAFRGGALQLAEPVVAAGYPLYDLLQNGLNVTVGNLSALSGPEGDRRMIQFSAPATFGNSGGPLMDSSGRLIGLVDQVMSAKLAQNINFAVSGPTIQSFLDENGVGYQIGKAAPASPAEIAGQARRHTVLLLCHK